MNWEISVVFNVIANALRTTVSYVAVFGFAFDSFGCLWCDPTHQRQNIPTQTKWPFTGIPEAIQKATDLLAETQQQVVPEQNIWFSC